MEKRPTSVTVIAWILIVTGGISLIGSTVTLNNPIVKETDISPKKCSDFLDEFIKLVRSFGVRFKNIVQY